MCRETAEDGRQDAPLSVVVDVDRAIEAGNDLESALARFVIAPGDDDQPAARRETGCDALHRERLTTGETDRPDALAGQELERQDAHPDQVRTVDPLVALGDDGPDAEESRAFRRPIPR